MVRARKRLGQHFLHDPYVIARIVQNIAPQRDDLMVEIGGGPGALTLPLVDKLEHLHVVELDDRLAQMLQEKVADPARLTVHRSDALRFDFHSLAGTGDRPLRVVGNLPYNISTPLLFHLLEHRDIVSDMHLMLQKEVVDRMTASPGGKDYGRLTVMLSVWAEIQALFEIGPGAFTPPPRVQSKVVRIVVRKTPRFEITDFRRFAALVAHLFSMRRKTLGRSLRGQISAEQIEALSIDPRARAETLQPADFARLAACIGPARPAREKGPE